MAYCRACGFDNPNNAKFCQECGNSTTAPLEPVVVEDVSDSDAGHGRQALSVVGAMAAVGFVAIFAIVASTMSVTNIEGSLESKGQAGDFVITPTSCMSGEHEQYFGVFMSPANAAKNGGIKVYKNPDGRYRVQVQIPGTCKDGRCNVADLAESDCEKFNVRVTKSNSSYNEIWLVDGHLSLACQLGPDAADTMKADIKFENCH